MIKIKGQYTDATIMTDYVDGESVSQITNMINNEAFTNPVIIMPDVHAGKGSVIGFTMKIGEKIIPNIVGVDIGCGVKTAIFDKKVNKNLLDYIKEKIPMGINVREKPLPNIKEYYYSLAFKNLCKKVGIDYNYALCSLGTLGGGNHFCEIGKSTFTSDIYITVHTGSRNLGKKICEYWQKKATNKTLNKYIEWSSTKEEAIDAIKAKYKKEFWNEKIKDFTYKRRGELKRLKSDLDYLEGEDAALYLDDMRIAQNYAKYNRELILQEIGVSNYGIESVHNYISFKDFIIRKGAIASYKNTKIIIPLNMRDGIFICEGKSNKDWNYSAPHGSGRLFSRREAKRILDMEEFENDMVGIISNISTNLIDEAPRAYKDSEEIEKLIEPTAEIIDKIIPILNIKGV
jgi:RNA-splicing ligase RtcB